MSATLELACGGDLGYLPHTAAMIASVFEHRGSLDVHVHYLHPPTLRPDDGRALARMVDGQGGRLTLVCVTPERTAHLPVIRHLTAATWYRVLIPELLPHVDRVLYLDGDAIALDSLGPLWATDLEGATVAAVTNVFEWWNSAWPAELGLRRPYFNAGVLLMDLARMRASDAGARILEHATRREEWPFGDQDPVNYVLADERLELHPRWNVQNSMMHFEEAAKVFERRALEEARMRPGIRHFEGPAASKPWHYLNEYAHRDQYERYRSLTPWPRYRREGVTPRNVAKKLLRPYVRALRGFARSGRSA